MWNQLFKRARTRGKTRRSVGPVRRRRLTWVAFEPLEQRALLSTYDWISSSSGDWNDYSNWIDEVTRTNGVPGSSDSAIIEESGINVSASGVGIGNLYSNADVEMSGSVSISGHAEIHGALQLDNGCQLDVSGAAASLEASGPIEFDGNNSIQAEKNASVSLPGLTSVAGSSNGTPFISFSASSGGTLDLPALTQATGELDFAASSAGLLKIGSNTLETEGLVSFIASGAGSVLALPSLASIAGSSGVVGTPSFTAANGGTLDLPALTQATGKLDFSSDRRRQRAESAQPRVRRR